LAQLAGGERMQVLAFEKNTAFTGFFKGHDQARQGGFARA
jgi:hypothetical protein